MSLRLVKQRSKLRRTAASATDDGGSSRAAEERITSFSAANAGRLPFIWRTLTPKTSRTFTSFLSIVVVAAASAAAAEIALCCYWLSFRSYKIVCRRAEAEAKTANTKQSLGRILTPLHAHAFSTLFTKRPSSWLAVALTEKKQSRQCTLFFF